MNLEIFKNILLEKFDNRSEKIAIMKSYEIKLEDKFDQEIMRTYLVPALYSIWEGFAKESIKEYLNYINEQNIILEKIDFNYIAYNFDNNDIGDKIKNGTKDFEKRLKIFFSVYKYLKEENFKINTDVNVESNLNLEVLNKILKKLKLNIFQEEIYKTKLNKLLMFRNSIAHGATIKVDKNTFLELSDIVYSCMDELIIILENGIKENVFLSKSK